MMSVNVANAADVSNLRALFTRRRMKAITATTVLAFALSTVGPTAGADTGTAVQPAPISGLPVADSGSASAAVELSAVHRIGSVVDTEENVQIREILDGAGNVIGYTFDDASRAVHEGTLAGSLTAEQPGQYTTAANFWTCSAAIAWFIASTVFPSARIAKLAWRLGGLVREYGLNTTVRILTGAHKLSSRTAQQEFRELALGLTGIGGLQAGCNFKVL